MKSLVIELLSPEHNSQWQANYLSLDDSLGRLGIKPGHHAFLSPLQRSVGYFEDLEWVRHFVAHDSGILRVEWGSKVYLISRVVLVGASLHVLKQELEMRLRRAEQSSPLIRENLYNLQRALIQQILALDLNFEGGKL